MLSFIIKSILATPLQPAVSKALTAASFTFAVTSASRLVEGTIKSDIPLVYFASKSYHSVFGRISRISVAKGSVFSAPSEVLTLRSRTPTVTKNPSINSSIRTSSLYSSAVLYAISRSSFLSTFVIPKLEPSLTGFTKSG